MCRRRARWLLRTWRGALLASKVISRERRSTGRMIGAGEKGPPRPAPGGREGRNSALLADPVTALALRGLEGLDRVAGLLQRAGH